jgi:hypothetical protein
LQGHRLDCYHIALLFSKIFGLSLNHDFAFIPYTTQMHPGKFVFNVFW